MENLPKTSIEIPQTPQTAAPDGFLRPEEANEIGPAEATRVVGKEQGSNLKDLLAGAKHADPKTKKSEMARQHIENLRYKGRRMDIPTRLAWNGEPMCECDFVRILELTCRH